MKEQTSRRRRPFRDLRCSKRRRSPNSAFTSPGRDGSDDADESRVSRPQSADDIKALARERPLIRFSAG